MKKKKTETLDYDFEIINSKLLNKQMSKTLRRLYEFNNLTSEKALEGAKQSIKNALELKKSAELLAKQKIWGVANSLLILAAEEGIKAFVLYTKFSTPSYKFEEALIQYLFVDHKVKHEFAKKSFLSLSNGFISFLQTIVSLLGKDKSNFKAEFMKHYEEAEKNKLNEKEVNKIKVFWEQADNNKNKGLYIDFNNNNWLNPQDSINEKIYKNTLMNANSIISISTMLMNDLIKEKINVE